MEKIFHITNGDSAVGLMEKSGLRGDFLPWRDVLHEGPVPAGLSLEAMSRVRAGFIAQSGWLTSTEAEEEFKARDNQLKQFREYDDVILWFEHDLYDQLQLLQLLDWFSQQQLENTRLSLICVDNYLGVMSPGEIAGLWGTQQQVTAEQLQLGHEAWTAYCAENPKEWQALNHKDTSSLPYVMASVVRHLEQYPSLTNGLSRTEQQLLQAVADGAKTPIEIFEANQQADGVRFMGDTTFWKYMSAMLECSSPLLQGVNGPAVIFQEVVPPYSKEFLNQDLSLTDTGKAVLAGEQSWLTINGIDKWLGGVHLQADNLWCWDNHQGALVKNCDK